MLAGHALLAEPYREGHAAVLRAAENAAPLEERRAWPERDELVWQLLVQSPLRDEAGTLAEITEVRELLPRLTRRAYDEGFDDGLRSYIGDEARRRFRVPARWSGVLRQSTRAELARMLRVLPSAGTWTGFLTASVG